MTENNTSDDSARSAGRAVARKLGQLQEEIQITNARLAREMARLTEADDRLAAQLSEEDRRHTAQLAEDERRLLDRLTEQERRLTAELAEEERRFAARLTADELGEGGSPVEDQRESRRTTPMSFALRADLKERLSKFRSDGGNINVSSISNDAIERELDRIQSGSAVAQRLRVELTERRGPSWTQGYQAGRVWAENRASWLEISDYATRYSERDVQIVGVGNTGFEEPVFVGVFRPPVQDYGEKASFERASDSYWETKTWECEAFWRAWIRAAREVYEENKANLPSVLDQLPTAAGRQPMPATADSAPRDVDPDDIPF